MAAYLVGRVQETNAAEAASSLLFDRSVPVTSLHSLTHSLNLVTHFVCCCLLGDRRATEGRKRRGASFIPGGLIYPGDPARLQPSEGTNVDLWGCMNVPRCGKSCSSHCKGVQRPPFRLFGLFPLFLRDFRSLRRPDRQGTDRRDDRLTERSPAQPRSLRRRDATPPSRPPTPRRPSRRNGWREGVRLTLEPWNQQQLCKRRVFAVF